jgi:hypothetical protein
MKNTTETYPQMTVAARIAGEDLKRGDFVTVLNELREWPSFMWSCTGLSMAADELVSIRHMPFDAGEPHKVIAVCLPFVYVKRTKGKVFPIDTRQQQLVRLDPANARLVWKLMVKKSKKKKKKKQKASSA